MNFPNSMSKMMEKFDVFVVQQAQKSYNLIGEI